MYVVRVVHFSSNAHKHRFIPVGSSLPLACGLKQVGFWLLVYAPQLAARLHLTNTQLNIVGIAANGAWFIYVPRLSICTC